MEKMEEMGTLAMSAYTRRQAVIFTFSLSAILALGGCAAAQKVARDAGTVFEQAAGTMLGKDDMPADDGTQCYSDRRVPFYEAANNLATANSVMDNVGNILAPMLQSTVAGRYSRTVGNRLAENFIGTMKAVLTDVTTDTENVKELSRRFNALVRCRRSEAADINARYRANQLARAAAEAKLADLRALMAVDIAKARATNKQIEARSEEFELAAKEARKEVNKAPTRTERKERETEVENVEVAVQTNQKVLDESETSVDEAEELASAPDGGFNIARMPAPFAPADEIAGAKVAACVRHRALHV